MATNESTSSVITDYHQYLSDPDVAVAVAVIKALTNVISRTKATTMMQLESELQEAASELKAIQPFMYQDSISLISNRHQNPIATAASCQLFLRYVTRCFLEFDDFDSCKIQLIDRGKLFAETSLSSRKCIAELGQSFITDGMHVLIHASSRVVTALLIEAAKTKHFSVFVTESRVNNSGISTADRLRELGIPVTLILDSAVGYYMERIDLVIVGAQGVVENGGIVNSIGTYTIAVLAKAMKTPVYVAAESYKFARLYPLRQQDVPQFHINSTVKQDEHLKHLAIDHPLVDYTPPGYITLMFTDLGVLTPSAVSDELIKLYQ